MNFYTSLLVYFCKLPSLVVAARWPFSKFYILSVKKRIQDGIDTTVWYTSQEKIFFS